jgi:hypothetical protein
MRIKIIMFLVLVISAAGVCVAQSDVSSPDNNDQQGNLFPNSSSEKAEGVYTTGPDSGSYINDQDSLFSNSSSDTNDQDNLFPESSSGKSEGDYGLNGGITTH